MRDATKWLCGLLVALMALTGPLLSRAAVVEAAELSSTAADVEVSDGDRVGAGVMNVVYVPGKAIVCGLGTVVSAAVQVGPVQQPGGLREERHRLHLIHESRNLVVTDQQQGWPPAGLEDPGDPVEPGPREGGPVGPPDAGREAGQEKQEQRGNGRAPERDRAYSISSLGGILPATCSGVSTQGPSQPSRKVATAARYALPSVTSSTAALTTVPRPQTMALPGT